MSEKSQLPQPEPRLQHHSTPPSLPWKPRRKHFAFHWSCLLMSSSKDDAPKEKYDTRVPPTYDHKDQGMQQQTAMPQEGQGRPHPPPSLGWRRAKTGFSPSYTPSANDADKPANHHHQEIYPPRSSTIRCRLPVTLPNFHLL
jgi:hypothetical protein